MTTLLVADPVFLEHHVPSGHPERPDRIRAIDRVLAGEAFAPLLRRPAPTGTVPMLLTAHDAPLIASIQSALPEAGLAALDPDTWLSPRSFEVALRAAGAGCMAVDCVFSGEVENAFCAVRPPGHHAEADRAMGFCLFNTAVIAARHAQTAHGAGRVAIIDWDVHHGNGTQAIVWSDPTILYASTHQMPLYPGTGAASETGVGNVVNAPLGPGADGVAFRGAFAGRILPALERFAADLIIISAGFDAHRRDPLASLELDEDDFAWATAAVMEVGRQSAGGRIVSLLEGGYDLAALAGSVSTHIEVLMGRR